MVMLELPSWGEQGGDEGAYWDNEEGDVAMNFIEGLDFYAL
jgi:hypothetical protein